MVDARHVSSALHAQTDPATGIVSASTTLRTQIIQQAEHLGLGRVGFAPATRLDAADVAHLNQWVAQGYGATMPWLWRDLDGRTDPSKAVEWAETVLLVAVGYDRPLPDETSDDAAVHHFSRYARGQDYHRVLKKRLTQLGRWIEQQTAAPWRAFVDASPLMERQHAVRAGLGWQGKNTLLLHPSEGSYTFLGALVLGHIEGLDQPLWKAHALVTPIISDHCGTCTQCLDACPTGALVQPYVLDSRLCISYETIEATHTGTADPSFATDGWIHGCDICQEVCPWVQQARRRDRAGDPAFDPRPVWIEHTLDQLAQWTDSDFDQRTRGSAVRRQTAAGLRINLRRKRK